MKHQTFVISLINATTRKEHILKEFNKANCSIQFFDAIDKNTLPNFYQNLPALKESELTTGERGCLASHFLLWQKCINENLDFITIFEDDIFVSQDIENFIENFGWLNNLQNIPFVLRLEASLTEAEHYICAALPKYKNRECKLLNSMQWGTAGYIISQDGAKFLIDYFTNLTSIDLPIDNLMFDSLLNRNDFLVMQLDPALVIQNDWSDNKIADLKSTIEDERKIRHNRHKHKNHQNGWQKFIVLLKRSTLKGIKKHYYQKGYNNGYNDGYNQFIYERLKKVLFK